VHQINNLQLPFSLARSVVNNSFATALRMPRVPMPRRSKPAYF
jgi:hypothetical protein